MNKTLASLIGLALALTSCHNEATDSIIGTWRADKVNVQFDEHRSTPELVKQVGEMEKQNRISISADSTLVFKGLDTEMRGRLSLCDNGLLYCDEQLFGQWTNGQIVTQTTSPLGQIVITYKKE